MTMDQFSKLHLVNDVLVNKCNCIRILSLIWVHNLFQIMTEVSNVYLHADYMIYC